MEVALVHFGEEPLNCILDWSGGKRRWMGTSHVALEVKGSGGCSWAAVHQLLSSAADHYVGHDVVVDNF